MRPIRRVHDVAGTFLMWAGLLHLPLFMFGGWNKATQGYVVIGIIWITVGLMLRSRKRWLVYVAFIMSLVGTVLSYTSMGSGVAPGWWWLLILLMNLAAAVYLFRIIWTKK